MKEKNENHIPEVATNKNGRQLSLPSWNEVHKMVWNAANFTTVAAATSASIVAVQNPVKTVLLSLTKNGALMPSYNGGVLGVARVLYAGTTASLSGSAARTVYVTTAKNNRPIDEVADAQNSGSKIKKSVPEAQVGYVVCATLGDIAVTQIPESLSSLKKVPGLLPAQFKWRTLNNASQLMTGGFAPRFAAGMVNFSCLCVVEQEVSNRLPIKNNKTKHFAAGAISGMTAAFCAYPFTVFKDYTLVQARVENGKLINKGTISVAKEMTQTLRANPKQVTCSFFKNAAKQMPLRMGLTGLIFSIVSGVGETLGNEPLKNVVPKSIQPK
ncbi:MAG: hypothetical protein EPN84_10260 [Legionella sp.]|nr:MAG: hypothetical protein EPN84_10260 [Legionella sp.]